ncbi:MAG: hypothetical protein AAFQ27_01760 [Pseudomonadota bacterium]
MRLPLVAALALTVGLSGCGDRSDTSERNNTPETGSPSVEQAPAAASSVQSEECGRDAAGQVDCLARSFAVENCSAGQVLGSMFRENEVEETHSYRTAYGLSSDCVVELKSAAKRRGFRENDKGELIAKPRSGYRETLIIGLQISADGSVVEWERVQE